MLLEALVGILIFAFGVLGIVGLQAAMTKAQTGAKLRGDAASLASEIRGAIWADIPNLNNYDVGSGNCTSLARCKAWTDKVTALLPAGSGDIDVTNNVVTITITWRPPNEEQHTYLTATTIRS